MILICTNNTASDSVRSPCKLHIAWYERQSGQELRQDQNVYECDSRTCIRCNTQYIHLTFEMFYDLYFKPDNNIC